MKTRLQSLIGMVPIVLVNLLAVMFSASVARAQQIGYVLELNGEWSLNGATHLHEASKLPAGGVLRTSSPSDRSFYIVVAGLNGNIIERRECRKQGECERPIQLPQSPGIISRLFSAIGDLLGSSPAKYVAPISKGDDPSEAVVELSGDQVDLADVFGTIDAGKYFVRFGPIIRDQDSTSGKSLTPVWFEWDPKHPKPLRVSGLVPGLSKLSIVEPHGENFRETGQDAWVLICDESQYAKRSNSFREALTITQQWGQQVHSDVVRGFLRAALDFVAKQN